MRNLKLSFGFKLESFLLTLKFTVVTPHSPELFTECVQACLEVRSSQACMKHDHYGDWKEGEKNSNLEVSNRTKNRDEMTGSLTTYGEEQWQVHRVPITNRRKQTTRQSQLQITKKPILCISCISRGKRRVQRYLSILKVPVKPSNTNTKRGWPQTQTVFLDADRPRMTGLKKRS